MKTKHVLFLSLSLFGASWASCSHSNEIQITGSVKNLAGGTIVYQKSIDGMFNSQAQDTLWLNADSTFSLTLPGNGTNRYACSCGESVIWVLLLQREEVSFAD